ncbi:hypothetical protein JCM10908_005576 [Rhodotorula pacifica]|uniref:uncharacterized protein n=1 Tax=Rhodotorula pacifica TaxID=1495444 RepID=UPI00316ED59E
MSTPASLDGALPEIRSEAEQVLRQWRAYFADPMLSLATLRQEAEEGRLPDRGLRSLSWRFFFDLLPAPTPLPSTPASGSSSTLSTYSLLLSQSRSAYSELRERYLRAPDGRWVRDGEDATLTGPANGGIASDNGAPRLAKIEVKGNNPLGLDEENPWKTWFADLELRKTIRQDVLRTFPDVSYFRSSSAQDRLTDLLFIFCKLTPQIGYRQGMHELLAPLLWLVDFDSLESAGDETSLPHITLAREFVEHDTWALFSALMKSAKVYYDHSASAAPTSKSAVIFPPPAPTSSSSSSPPLVQPAVAIASHIHSTLRTLDPDLHAAFTRLQIEPQIYAIRWLRLLFSREFPLSDTMQLWDGLFARDPSLQLANHICLAMLIRVRNLLLRAAAEGYGEFIQVLLRYPACDDGKYRTPLLLQQALFLRDNLSPAAAAHLVSQNVKAGAASGPPVESHNGLPTSAGSQQASSSSAHRRSPSTAAAPQGLGFLENGLVGDLAKGVYGRAEALGINKALRGTFDEIKRTVAEAQAQAEERRRLNAYSQIPARPPWDPQRSPPPPPVVDKDTLADLATMRASCLAMSEAVDVCVAVLEKSLAPTDEPAAPAASGTDPVADSSAAQMMALTALRHVRDVLGGQAPTFDSSVLQPLKELSPSSRAEETSRTATKPPSPTSAERAPTPGPRAPSPSRRGPVDGLGAGFARLGVSSAPLPSPAKQPTENRSTPPSVNSSSYPPAAASRKTASATPPEAGQSRHVTPQPPPAQTPSISSPPSSQVQAAARSTASHRDECRGPFDPLGVL